MPRTNPDSEENIRRIDSLKAKGGGGGTHGFQVHFNRAQVNFTRLFSDALCNGMDQARLAAREFREILRVSIPKTRNGPARTGLAHSNTGHMGVSISSDARTTMPNALIVEATVRVAKGKSKNMKFRVNNPGELGNAIQEAVAWRQSLLIERTQRDSQPGESGEA